MSTTMNANPAAARRYSHGAILLHWLIALLIVLNYVAVWVAENLDRPRHMQVMANHKAFGITILLLTVLRIVWRLTHRPPPLEPSLKRWEVALAHTTHALLYGLMLAIPLAGWALHSAYSKGAPVSWFGLVDVPALPVAYGEASGGFYGGIHETLAFAMLGLLALHVAGALKHQFIDRDGTLGRMIPWLRRRAAPTLH